MTGDNPFKIIEPNEEPPKTLKKELMGSVRSLVFILRFVQLFMADATAVLLTNLRIDLDTDKNEPTSEES